MATYPMIRDHGLRKQVETIKLLKVFFLNIWLNDKQDKQKFIHRENLKRIFYHVCHSNIFLFSVIVFSVMKLLVILFIIQLFALIKEFKKV